MLRAYQVSEAYSIENFEVNGANIRKDLIGAINKDGCKCSELRSICCLTRASVKMAWFLVSLVRFVGLHAMPQFSLQSH